MKNTPQILSTYRTYIGTDSLASNLATHQDLILRRWNYYKGRFWLQFSFCNHFKMLISISDTAFCSALLWISLVLSLLTPSLPLPTALSPQNFRIKEEKGTNGKGRWENRWGENRKYLKKKNKQQRQTLRMRQKETEEETVFLLLVKGGWLSK